MSRIKTKFLFEFHFCFDPPSSCDAIALDVVFRWCVPEMDNRWHSETVLRATRWIGEDKDGDYNFVPLSVRYGNGMLRLGRGRDRARFRRVGEVESGGNLLWEIVRVVGREQAHVFNWLRRQRWDIDEWDEEFREELWESRRSLDTPALRRYGRGFCRQFVAQSAIDRGATVAEILKEV